VIAELHFSVSDEVERVKFSLFFNFFKKNLFDTYALFYLREVSNFQQELLGDFCPQLSYNVSKSLNAVLQNCYKRGFINKLALTEGLHTFYSDRRDK
jgi:hypothetical protein